MAKLMADVISICANPIVGTIINRLFDFYRKAIWSVIVWNAPARYSCIQIIILHYVIIASRKQIGKPFQREKDRKRTYRRRMKRLSEYFRKFSNVHPAKRFGFIVQ